MPFTHFIFPLKVPSAKASEDKKMSLFVMQRQMYKHCGTNSDGRRDRRKHRGLWSTGVGEPHFAEHHFSATFCPQSAAATLASLFFQQAKLGLDVRVCVLAVLFGTFYSQVFMQFALSL